MFGFKQEDRMERLEAKIDRLTWLVVGMLTLLVGAIVPGLLRASLIAGAVVAVAYALILVVPPHLPWMKASLARLMPARKAA